MLDALDRYGMGNWIDISEAIGSKTLEETRDHYLTHYLDSQSSPLPASSSFSAFSFPCSLLADLSFLFFSFLFFSFLFFSFLFFSFLFFSFLFFSFLCFSFLCFSFLFFSFSFFLFFLGRHQSVHEGAGGILEGAAAQLPGELDTSGESHPEGQQAIDECPSKPRSGRLHARP